MFTMPGNDVTVKAVFAKKKNMENHDNSISESVTKDNSGEKPGMKLQHKKPWKKMEIQMLKAGGKVRKEFCHNKGKAWEECQYKW
mgnify:CR=1 FL=1